MHSGELCLTGSSDQCLRIAISLNERSTGPDIVTARPLSLPSDLYFDQGDINATKALPFEDVQGWCSARTKEYHLWTSALRSVRNTESECIEHPDLSVEDAKEALRIQPSDIVSWCDSRIHEYKSRIRGLRSIHNSAAPISYSLPTELLMEVFGNVHCTSHRKSNVGVLHVCRVWRTVILQTPQFWANLLSIPMVLPNPTASGRGSLKFMGTLLKRSGTLPLYLTIRCLPDLLAQLFIQHRHRILSLDMMVSARQTGALGCLLEKGLPQLGELRISAHYPTFSPDIPSYGCLPRLAVLSVPRIHFRPESASPSLRHLVLTSCRCDNHLTEHLDPLLRALHECPNLETLTIKYALPWIPESHNGPNPPPRSLNPHSIHASYTAHLPALRAVDIQGYAWQTIVFLSRLRFPDTARVHVVIEGTGGALWGLRAGIPQLSRTDRVGVWFSGPTVFLEIPKPGASFIPVSDCAVYVKILPRAHGWRRTYEACAVGEVRALFAPIETITTLVAGRFYIPKTGVEAPEKRELWWTTLLGGFPNLENLEVPRDTTLRDLRGVAGCSADPDEIWSTSDTIPESGLVVARGHSNLRITIRGGQ